MKIEIYNNTAIGSLEISSRIYLEPELLCYLTSHLYNFELYWWYELEYDKTYVKMKGSIISMMQFRKFILRNWPDALKE